MSQTDRLSQLIRWYRRALRFVLPVECLGCNRSLSDDPVPFFCRYCWESIVPMAAPSCARCDQPFASSASTSWTPDHQCQSCLEHPPAYRRAWTLYPYLPPLQNTICSFKYQRKVALAKPLGTLMLSALPKSVMDADLIVPVPLHPTRLRSREFNQSLLLADQIGCSLSKPVSATNLLRVTATDPQTTLSRRERLSNLRNAFAVRGQEALAGQRILLVDDVFTTGTTLNECAKMLLKSGAETVSAVTLARTIETSFIPDRLLAQRAMQIGNSPGV